MTRRSQKRIRRAIRRAVRFTRHVTYAYATQGLFAIAWSTHPRTMATLVTAVGVLTAAIVTHRSARKRALIAAGVPTALYQWWFHDAYCDPHRPRSWYGYTGISNSPRDRAAQHADDSWWHPLTDPALYTEQWFENRWAAEKAERAAIRRHCGIGNVAHNPAYRQQRHERERLQMLASGLGYQQRRRRLMFRRPIPRPRTRRYAGAQP